MTQGRQGLRKENICAWPIANCVVICRVHFKLVQTKYHFFKEDVKTVTATDERSVRVFDCGDRLFV